MNSPLNADCTVTNAHSNAGVNNLGSAYAAAAALAANGIKVYAALVTVARRPVLMVDALPEGVQRVDKVCHPNGKGGTTRITVAEFQGCQLEWTHDTYTPEQAARIARALNGGKPQLEVVDGRR